ncbi:SIR2 family protein [Gimibacter soli]|uniref:SIR2 family protein n=1 Tax=Gimibacter soli TaxID=3024400 RepID=A0AAF0BIL2_9PROT|nr:SIR2 family protein [Gimibacter soli]WCL55543.1 SIR2 family protein [Gimibacter soli]
MTNEPLDVVAKIAQDCFQHFPVIVLGSGASVSHQIRGMGALAQYLLDHVPPEGDKELDAWTLIRGALANDMGLEEALQQTAAPASLVKKIVNFTWKAIASDDLSVLRRAASGEEALPLAALIQGLFRSTNPTLNIVTPNYDRVAEYASDMAGVVHNTGFIPGFIRQREGADKILVRRGNAPARTVRIWKVHGSLDWFQDPQGRVLSLPLSSEIPQGFSPVIVTPGVSKYERTHEEPFRSALQGADEALGAASAFLCVGYGFRDAHIQPKLVERCRQRNVPIVILAKVLTDEAKEFLAKSAGTSYLAMEECEGGTRAYSHAFKDGVILPDVTLWSFEKFNELVL